MNGSNYIDPLIKYRANVLSHGAKYIQEFCQNKDALKSLKNVIILFALHTRAFIYGTFLFCTLACSRNTVIAVSDYFLCDWLVSHSACAHLKPIASQAPARTMAMRAVVDRERDAWHARPCERSIAT